jgi:L-fuculose-phosphate aldolase
MLETICEVLSEAYKRNWITARDGNASLRFANDHKIYVTPSAVRKQTMQPGMFKIIDARSGAELEGCPIQVGLRPTGELPLHYGLQKVIDEDVRVVLHLHPTYTIAAMLAGIDLSKLVNEFPELGRYTSVAPTVPDVPPISQELADACMENLVLDGKGSIRYNIVGIDRHGVVAIANTPWRAMEHIERLEHICKIALASRITF